MRDEEVVPRVVDPVKHIDRLLVKLERQHLLEEINALCAQAGALIEEVFGDSRRAHVSRVRNAIWFFLREDKSWSYPAIADLFCRDHTTVMAGVQKRGRELGLVKYAASGKKSRRAA